MLLDGEARWEVDPLGLDRSRPKIASLAVDLSSVAWEQSGDVIDMAVRPFARLIFKTFTRLSQGVGALCQLATMPNRV